MFKNIILDNCLKYPEAMIQDIFKLIYQSSFGCEHFCLDKAIAYRKLIEEWNEITPIESELVSDIGNGFCRINLKHAKAIGLDKDLIFKIFCLSCDNSQKKDNLFYENIDIFKKLCDQNELEFSSQDVDEFFKKWKSDGGKPVSHTLKYKDKYHPAYRVILKQYADYIMLFDDIIKQTGRITVGIDGKCASGKSTLGKMFEEIFECNLFHADDYFLPPEKRTSERLCEKGGNFDYERFNIEIIKGIESNQPFTYTPFRCCKMDFAEPVSVVQTELTVVEGSYCMHPYLDDIYDIKVFLDIDYQLQKKRILQRNGQEKLKDFVDKWIPMENRYFNSFDIKHKCEYLFNSNM